MAWFLLVLAGFFETGFATALRYIDGLTRIPPIIVFVVCGATSLFLLTQAAQTIPVGTAYAVWVGVGAGLTAVIGMTIYHEPVTTLRIIFLVQLISSIIGLKLVSAE